MGNLGASGGGGGEEEVRESSVSVDVSGTVPLSPTSRRVWVHREGRVTPYRLDPSPLLLRGPVDTSSLLGLLLDSDLEGPLPFLWVRTPWG